MSAPQAERHGRLTVAVWVCGLNWGKDAATAKPLHRALGKYGSNDL